MARILARVMLPGMRHQANSQRLRLLSLLALPTLVLFGPAACRLKSPTLAEQRELASRGALNGLNGKADWVASPIQRGQQIGMDHSAGIPDYTQGGSGAIDNLSSQILPQTNNAAVAAVADRELSETSSEQKNTTAEVPREDSPLDRISRSCPGSDAEVTSALKTINRDQRMAKYMALTAKCPGSSDLWDWLGSDYLQAGKLDNAKEAFQKAVLLDSANQEAKGHLSEAQRRLAESMRPGK